MRWFRNLFATRVTRTHTSTHRLSPKQETELWAHFHASMDEMDKAAHYAF